MSRRHMAEEVLKRDIGECGELVPAGGVEEFFLQRLT